MNEKLIKIGATLNPHGLKGELKLFVEEQHEEDLFNTDTVFLTISGKKIPYFVESIRGGNALIIKFEDVDDINAAQRIAKKDIEIRESDLIPDDERETPLESDFEFLIGYTLFDQKHEIGKIEDIIELPHQEMAVIQYKGKEIYVPLNENLIDKINEKQQKIIMDLPEGLLDL